MTTCPPEPALEEPEFYRRALEVLGSAGLPFLLAGAFALERHTGVSRRTKDLDLFVRPRDLEAVLAAFRDEGFPVEKTFPHWLGNAFCAGHSIDVIYRSANGYLDVEDTWFERAVEGEVLGRKVLLCAPEEMIWSKSFIMERERYDGADVMHLMLRCGRSIDWEHLCRRFGAHWRVLLSYLVLFGFVYPSEAPPFPPSLLESLVKRLHAEPERTEPKICQGTLLSRTQYQIDLAEWGFEDARKFPMGLMSEADIAAWTAAGENEQPARAGLPGG